MPTIQWLVTALLAESSLSSAGDRSGWKGVVGEPVRNGEPERPQARPDLTPRDAVAPQPKGGGRPSRKTIRTHTTGAFETHDLASAEGAAEFVLFLAVTPYGRIRLGADDDRPEFRTVSWIAMMFSAGMGIGLMFFGVAEPISHLAAPPLGLARPGTEAAAAKAIEYTYFHWALHPWALYAVVGLALGYFCFRRGMPNLISSVFYPLLGERVNGPIGKGIDTLAIFATMFGSATSLGLGAPQINSGLSFVWGVDSSTGLAAVIISVLTLLFVLSAVSGVERGVQWLSNFNMVLAVLLALFLLVAGPTVFIFGTLTTATGDYFGPDREELPDRRLRRIGMARELDDLLLGLVDVVDAVRRHVPGADLEGPDRARVRDRVLLIRAA